MNGAALLPTLLPIFLVGLAGSVHCVGMCGGIIGAITASASAPARVIPINVASTRTATLGSDPVRGQTPALMGSAVRVLAYNAGRIGSYMVAGAIAGGLADSAHSLTRMTGLQHGFYWLANLMLVALGLYLMNAWRGVAVLEQGGRVLWRRAQPVILPLMKTLLPADRPYQALALGALWGWLPCGMVYSVLLTAMFSGDAFSGAAVMLAFGLGTLPVLTGLGLLGARVRRAMQQRPARLACGLLVLSFGALGLVRAAGGTTPDWIDIICLTPHQ